MARHRIRLLGISGSPREASTAFAITEALKYAKKEFKANTEYYSLRKKKINFCIHCDYCVRKRKGCVYDDAMVDAYDKVEKADALIIGTPVYNGSISGSLKTFLDRCRAMVARNPDILKDKVGAGVAVGGDRNGGQDLALLTIHSFYLSSKMIPASGGPFGANLGGTIWSRDQGRKGAERDVDGMKTIRVTVDRLMELAALVKGRSKKR